MELTDLLLKAEELSGIGGWTLEAQSRRLQWTPQAFRLHGLAPDGLQPTLEDSLSHVPADERAAMLQAVRTAIEERVPCSSEYTVSRPDGSCLRLRSVMSPASEAGAAIVLVGTVQAVAAVSPNHRPLGMDPVLRMAVAGQRQVLGVTIDTTEGRRNSDAEEAQVVLDLMVSQAGFGFGWWDVNTGAGEWSQRLKCMFGLPPNTPTPSPEAMLARIDEGERERVRDVLVRPWHDEALRVVEFGLTLPDGSHLYLMWRVVQRPETAGRPQRLYCVAIDTTEARAQQRQLVEALARLKLATEVSGIGTWERDIDAERAVWDDTTRALWALNPDELVPDRHRYYELIHPEDRERVRLAIESHHLLHQRYEFEFRVLRPDGSVVWLATRGRVIVDDQGRPVRRTGITFDVTLRRAAEAALQAKEVAERSNAAKTEFLARMSHELRTPLNAVLGFAQLLAMDEYQTLTPTQREWIAHIHASGWHLLALINDILDLARIESGKVQLDMALVPLDAVADECLAMNAALAAERGVVQTRWHGDAHFAVWADRTRLKQVLLNLLSNATKYNRRGGLVGMKVLPRATGELALAVQDNGLGMSPEQLAHLFEPFNRLGRAHGAVEGTGIGLALSRSLMQQMGGRIDVASTPGVGSTFTLLLYPQRPVDPALDH